MAPPLIKRWASVLYSRSSIIQHRHCAFWPAPPLTAENQRGGKNVLGILGSSSLRLTLFISRTNIKSLTSIATCDYSGSFRHLVGFFII